MAYHLQSLVKVVELILNSQEDQRKFFEYHKIILPQIESLLEKACFLRDSLATILVSQQDRTLLASTFEDQVRYAAQNAEDVLETYIVDCLSQSYRSPFNFLYWRKIPYPDLKKLLEDFDSIKEEMRVKILEGSQTISDSLPSSPVVSSSSRRSTADLNPKKLLVGFGGDLIQLKERVLGEYSFKLEIIPIVGMGGIGKTTLARKIYDDTSVVSHFDARAWTTVSDNYNLHNIFLDLLCCLTKRHRDELIQEIDSNKYGIELHKNLMGRRYLIVLDDIWRSKAWDEVKMFFPNDNNRGRVILTTRESNVATYADAKSPHHHVRPLGEDDGWKLLKEKIFGDQETTCPRKLKEIGLKIASNCGGLPLAIHVIGGLLSHVKPTEDSWNQVADDVSSAIANYKEGEDFSSRILSLSYDHLPYYLKPCFLYMSAFPEYYEIPASMLIRLWVAEGFLKPIEDKSPEEAAETYLEALIDRNLVFASQRQRTNGKVKSCVMHDLLRDLCVTKAREEKFFHIINNNTPQENTLCQRRLSVASSTDNFYSSIEQMSFARSLIFIDPASPQKIFSSHISSSLRLLRVLDLLKIRFIRFPESILKLVNIRYLSFSWTDDHTLDPRITRFRNLHTLIVRFWGFKIYEVTPELIFNMPSLRVIKFISEYPVWCDLKEYSNNLLLPLNLQSLSALELSSDFDIMVFEKIPNLKKLGICRSNESDHDSMVTLDLTCLRKLETLKCHFMSSCLSSLIFPFSLKKLSLINCEVVSEACMKRIGMLPNLEILKLENVAFERNTWELSEGEEFCRLQLLQLERVKLVDWSADETNFPILQHLEIRRCYTLKEIPSGIGEISTLKTIEVYHSTPSADASARRIQEEQLHWGNDLLQLHVVPSLY